MPEYPYLYRPMRSPPIQELLTRATLVAMLREPNGVENLTGKVFHWRYDDEGKILLQRPLPRETLESILRSDSRH